MTENLAGRGEASMAASKARQRRKKCNIERQERVVSALWEFARDIQQNPNKGCVATAVQSGTKLSLDHVGEALREIMDTFGYGVLEVQ